MTPLENKKYFKLNFGLNTLKLRTLTGLDPKLEPVRLVTL